MASKVFGIFRIICLMKIYFVVSKPATNTDDSTSATCSPALKTKEYLFLGSFQHSVHESLEIVWLRNTTPVSMCKSNMACYDYSDLKTNTTIKMFLDSVIQYRLVIKHVSDLDEAVWSLKYLGLASLRKPQPLFSCSLYVFDFSALTFIDCPVILVEGAMLNCTCAHSNETAVAMEYSWFDKNGSVINNGDHLMSIIASRENMGYECRGRTSTGEKAVPITYAPYIIAKGKSIECGLNLDKTGPNVVCTVQKVFPTAICEVTIDGNGSLVDHSQKYIVYRHEVMSSSGPLYYNTQCTIQLEIVLPGYYNVVIRIYPNVTGSVNDKMYALKKEMYFNYETKKEEDNFNGTNAIITWVTVIGSMYIALLVIIIRCMRRFAHKQPKPNVPVTMAVEIYKNESENSDVKKNFNAIDFISSEKDNATPVVELHNEHPDLQEMGPLLKIKCNIKEI